MLEQKGHQSPGFGQPRQQSEISPFLHVDALKKTARELEVTVVVAMTMPRTVSQHALVISTIFIKSSRAPVIIPSDL